MATAAVGPIAVGIDATNDDFYFYGGGIYYHERCNPEYLDHAVLVVGYGEEDDSDYWLVKNSWGIGWGENGYVRMARNKDNNCGIASHSYFPVMY